MKRRLFTFALAALTIGLLGSCSKINERIDGLDKRVYDLENNKIASVEQQITAINTSINELKAADVTINGKIADLKTAADAQQALIDALQEADRALGQKDTELEARIATLEGQVATINGQIDDLVNADIAINTRIDTLSAYVDTQIGKAKDWATATFASLTEYEKTAEDLAKLSVTVEGISTTLAGMQTSIDGLDTKIDGIDAALQGKITDAKTELEGKITSLKTELEDKIATAITASEKSIKSWINELLKGYYTAAVVEAKIGSLNTAIEAAKDTAKTRIDSVATELTTLKTAVDTAKANIRTEYKNAIDVAINKLDGEIRGALLDSIAAVNGRIEALDTRVKTLEGKVLTLEGKVDKLLAMIQSVSITPAYSDGSVEAVNGILTLKCIVSPAEALIGMESLKDSLLIYADSVKVKTKATTPAYMTIEVSEASVLDAAQGAITLKADISEYLPKGEDKALTVAVNIKNGISDYTTGFVSVCVEEESCIAAGTMITMENGEQKAVEKLELGDAIRTFDHETGEVSSSKVCFIMSNKNVAGAFTLTFEDGISVCVIEEHGFYDWEEQKYAFINPRNAKDYIGHHFYDADNERWLELKSCEVLPGSVDAYAIVTSRHLNHTSNGMLSMCDGTIEILANLFEYDNQMRFDTVKKNGDIEKYGLTSKEKVLEYEGFTESDYENYNLQYLDIAIGKGLTSWELVQAFSDYCVANGIF